MKTFSQTFHWVVKCTGWLLVGLWRVNLHSPRTTPFQFDSGSHPVQLLHKSYSLLQFQFSTSAGARFPFTSTNHLAQQYFEVPTSTFTTLMPSRLVRLILRIEDPILLENRKLGKASELYLAMILQVFKKRTLAYHYYHILFTRNTGHLTGSNQPKIFECNQ